MWSYIFSTVSKNSNYNLMNVDNIYKFMIVTMETLNEDQKKKFVENIKLQLGMTLYEDFKMYVFRKLPKSELLKYFSD